MNPSQTIALFAAFTSSVLSACGGSQTGDDVLEARPGSRPGSTGKQVNPGDYLIARCVSSGSELGGHATLILVAKVAKVGGKTAITTITAPKLEFAPALSAKYRNASSQLSDQGEVFKIEVIDGTIQMKQSRTFESITLNLSADSVSINFQGPGSTDGDPAFIRPENCTFTNLDLFKNLSAAP